MARAARWLSRCAPGIFSASLIATPGLADCSPDRVDLRANGALVRFSVEIADDAAERAQGLMHRDSLPRFSGMLFLFDAPQPVGFWMKNTLIPLDMLFIDESGTVRSVHHKAQPGDLTSIRGGADTLAVLEINGGLARRLRLGPGAQLRHPAFDAAKAAWPCETS